MGAISLGSAYFELTANSASLIQALAKSEAASKKSVEAISKATGVLEKDVARLANTYLREETRRANASAQATLKIIKAYNDAGDAADKAAARAAGAGRTAEGAFLGGAKSAVGFATSLVGIVGAAELARNAIAGVYTSTKNLEQAQFAVNKLYGGGAKDISEFAEQLSKSSGRSKNEALEAAAAVANLGRQYAFTSEQQKNLLKISADLAALKGITLPEATKRISDAMRGEAEAAEYLGQVLNNDAVKAMAEMTDEQRKNFETLNPITKAQLTYGKLVKDNNDLLGSAAERTQTLGGSTDNLKGAMSDLAATLGSSVSPALIDIQNSAAGATRSFTAMLQEGLKLQQLGQPDNLKRLEAVVQALQGRPAMLVQQVLQGQARQEEQAAAGGAVPFGPSPEEVRDAIARYNQLKAKREDDIRTFVEERKRAIEDVAEAEEKAARAAAAAEANVIEQRKIQLEVRREAELKALDERRDAALRAIEVEAAAAKKAAEHAIEQAEWRKDAEIAAVEEAHDQVVTAIKAQQDALEATREQEDRDRDDIRRKEDQALDDFRKRQDDEVKAAADALDQRRALEDRARADRQQAEDAERARRRQAEDRELQEAREREDRDLAARAQALARRREQEDRERADRRTEEDRALADARAAEDAALEASQAQRLAAVTSAHEATIKALDEQAEALRRAFEEEEAERERLHELALTALEDEAEAARRLHDETLAALDAQAREEDDRHREALRAIDAERDARLRAIDEQLGILDAAEDAEEQAARDRRLADAVTNARLGVTKAESTGNYSEILKARQELADAEDAIRRENVKRERDAAREALRAQAQAIKDELDAEEEAERERNRLRDREIDDARETAESILAAQLAAIKEREEALKAAYTSEREAARTEFEARLEEIRQRKEAEQTAHEELLERLQAEFAAEKERIEARRLAEDRDRDDRRKEEDREWEDRRKKQDRELDEYRQRIADRRADEDRDRADRRREEDAAIAASRQAQDRRRQDERSAEDQKAQQERQRLQHQRQDEDRAIADSRLAQDRRREDERKAQDAALAAQLAAAAATQEQERKAIEAHYNGPNGVITQLRAAMTAADEAYKERLRLARQHFDSERDALNAVYRNTAKTGLLDLQDEAARNNAEKLSRQLGDIASWKEQANRFIEDHKTKWQGVEQAIIAVGNAIRNLPAPPPLPNNQGGYGNVPYGPGGGPGPNPPPTYNPPPSASPGLGTPTPGSGQVNVDPGRFTTSFGFLQRYSNPFNPRIPRHRGVDLVIAGAPHGGKGLPVGSFRDGTVVALTNESNGGNGIIMRHGDGLYGRYFHFDALNVRTGQSVRRGDQIGILGESGTQGSPHLHYEISRSPNGDYEDAGLPLIDPTPYMRDSGYLFREPTLTYGLRTGERNLIAERRPELLLGGAATKYAEALRRAGTGKRPVAGLPAPPSLMDAGAAVAGGYQFSGAAAPERLSVSASRLGPRQEILVDIAFDGQTKERVWIEGYQLLARRGDLPAGIGGS